MLTLCVRNKPFTTLGIFPIPSQLKVPVTGIEFCEKGAFRGSSFGANLEQAKEGSESVSATVATT